MTHAARVLSLLALVGTIGPPVLFFLDRFERADVKFWMLVSTIVWFAATPVWMERER